jgi:hypothetical protein
MWTKNKILEYYKKVEDMLQVEAQLIQLLKIHSKLENGLILDELDNIEFCNTVIKQAKKEGLTELLQTVNLKKLKQLIKYHSVDSLEDMLNIQPIEKDEELNLYIFNYDEHNNILTIYNSLYRYSTDDGEKYFSSDVTFIPKNITLKDNRIIIKKLRNMLHNAVENLEQLR